MSTQDERLHTAHRLTELAHKLTETTQQYSQVAKATSDPDFLPKYEQEMGRILAEMDGLIASMLPESERTQFLNKQARLKIGAPGRESSSH